MAKKNKGNISNFFKPFTIWKWGGLFIVIVISIFIGKVMLEEAEITMNHEYCCNGKVCSDTYYDHYGDKLCHLTLCEHNVLILNKSVCTYNSTEPYKEGLIAY